jgi:cyclic-di-GMP phosphodiesterase TipF (flagellum assembly factor)
MVRIGAIFVAVCMVLIAASIGAVLFLAFKLDLRTAALIALGALMAMALFNTISSRLADRRTLGDQIADLSRGTADLARQVAEMARRLNAMETKVDKAVERARGAVDPLAAEMGELGTLVRQIAETVASHAAALQKQGGAPAPAPPAAELPKPAAAAPALDGALNLTEREAVSGPPPFKGLTRDGIAEMVANAVDGDRIDLYLQPVVTLPQRKVRYYEAVSRLRTEAGEVVPAGDFIEIAESVRLMPKIDNLLMFRCVQVVRRLQLKSRDVGLFCNISAATLTDATFFKQFLDFMDANRALNNALMFEFSQSAYRAFGPLENESLAALAERGFRFSMDHVTDLRMEPKELADHWFRFLKVPAKMLLDKATGAQSDIHPEDLADLLARAGIDLIAERIESEGMVVDLLDYDVRFGQGFLFSPPRPVRAEALQLSANGADAKPDGEPPTTFAAAGAAT